LYLRPRGIREVREIVRGLFLARVVLTVRTIDDIFRKREGWRWRWIKL
jgi:hypothetical protein